MRGQTRKQRTTHHTRLYTRPPARPHARPPGRTHARTQAPVKPRSIRVKRRGAQAPLPLRCWLARTALPTPLPPLPHARTRAARGPLPRSWAVRGATPALTTPGLPEQPCTGDAPAPRLGPLCRARRHLLAGTIAPPQAPFSPQKLHDRRGGLPTPKSAPALNQAWQSEPPGSRQHALQGSAGGAGRRAAKAFARTWDAFADAGGCFRFSGIRYCHWSAWLREPAPRQWARRALDGRRLGGRAAGGAASAAGPAARRRSTRLHAGLAALYVFTALLLEHSCFTVPGKRAARSLFPTPASLVYLGGRRQSGFVPAPPI